MGGVADLVDGGAFVGADDLAFVEEDDGMGDVFQHGGQVGRQARAGAFDPLGLVDDAPAWRAVLRRALAAGNSSRAAPCARTASWRWARKVPEGVMKRGRAVGWARMRRPSRRTARAVFPLPGPPLTVMTAPAPSGAQA
ncbi:hypothetical protein ACIGAN_31970 [Streptomyces sp. NPDC085931]|uniref:hypothetical protein n=1 Tax=Streptomyces sp. NPDC085931 TaxID=3365740 RepID=UPI0037D32358